MPFNSHRILDVSLNAGTAKKIKNKKDISMASPEEVKTQTGYTIGGVSPVGHLNKLEIFIDKSLERFNELFAAAGHPNCVFKINYNDIQKITNGKNSTVSKFFYSYRD